MIIEFFKKLPMMPAVPAIPPRGSFAGQPEIPARMERYIIQYVQDDKKITLSMTTGDILNLPDDIGHGVLAKYPGIFKVKSYGDEVVKNKSKSKKVKPNYENKKISAVVHKDL